MEKLGRELERLEILEIKQIARRKLEIERIAREKLNTLEITELEFEKIKKKQRGKEQKKTYYGDEYDT